MNVFRYMYALLDNTTHPSRQLFELRLRCICLLSFFPCLLALPLPQPLPLLLLDCLIIIEDDDDGDLTKATHDKQIVFFASPSQRLLLLLLLLLFSLPTLLALCSCINKLVFNFIKLLPSGKSVNRLRRLSWIWPKSRSSYIRRKLFNLYFLNLPIK